MGAFVNGNLMNGERVAHTLKWHWVVYVLPTLSIFLGIGIVWLPFKILQAWTSEVAITDRRLLGKVGIIARDTYDFPLDTIASIQIDQGIFGRLIGFGSLRFKNDGEYFQIPLFVGSPQVIRNMFAETQHKFKADLHAGKINA
jgi:uncharacterized membrane protein YdbT with pleckstrin-like domain